MQVRWYGQSAFTLTGSSTTVTIDPFGEFPRQARAATCAGSTRRCPRTTPTCC